MLSEHRIVERDTTPTLTVREKVPGDRIAERLTDILPKVYEVAGEHASGQPFAIWHGVTGDAPNQMFDMEAGAPLDEAVEGSEGIQASHLPGGTVLEVTYKGPYEGLSAAYQEVIEWMETKGYKPTGAPWDWYIDDPVQVGPADCRTLICWPVSI